MDKIVIDLLSDTHNRHEFFKCKGGDIVLHSGDCTSRGSIDEALDFLDWYGKLPYKYKVLIAGNHDWIFEQDPETMKEECDKRGIILLNDSGAELDFGQEKIKVWGSPIQPWFYDWAFNRNRGEDIKKHWDLIPKDTEVLLTHGPPHGILDKVSRPKDLSVGCEELIKKIKETSIKLHVFGHIHEGRGYEYQGDTTFVNASSLNRMYTPADDRPMRVSRERLQDGSIVYLY